MRVDATIRITKLKSLPTRFTISKTVDFLIHNLILCFGANAGTRLGYIDLRSMVLGRLIPNRVPAFAFFISNGDHKMNASPNAATERHYTSFLSTYVDPRQILEWVLENPQASITEMPQWAAVTRGMCKTCSSELQPVGNGQAACASCGIVVEFDSAPVAAMADWCEKCESALSCGCR